MATLRTHIEFAPATAKAPPEVCERARAFFEDVLQILSAVPEENAFWDSLQVSLLAHTEQGWTFLYRFNGRTLVVYDARPA